MSQNQFVHLHLHSDYSMLDGACDVEKLVDRVKELGMPAVAMTASVSNFWRNIRVD